MITRQFVVTVQSEGGLRETEAALRTALETLDPAVAVEWAATKQAGGELHPVELPPVGFFLVVCSSWHQDDEDQASPIYLATAEEQSERYGFDHTDYDCNWAERALADYPADTLKWCGLAHGWVPLAEYASRIRELESQFHWVPDGYTLLRLQSVYYGSHGEYGEGDCLVYFAVPSGEEVPSISLGHGHSSKQLEELGNLPAGTLEWREDGWVPYENPYPPLVTAEDGAIRSDEPCPKCGGVLFETPRNGLRPECQNCDFSVEPDES